MRRIDLQFVPRTRQWTSWALLAVVIFLAFDAAGTYASLRKQLADSRRPPVARTAVPVDDAGVPESTKRELDAARRIYQELALPWGALFRAVESATGPQAALLSIEPDAARGLVRITGEVKDYPAVIEFMKRLEATGVLERAHLVSHEVREDQAQRPTFFALVAYWRSNP
jgi:FMN phosphatase YigB (HAD superfamily)